MAEERKSKLQIGEHRVEDVVVLTLTGEITLDDGDLVFGRYVDAVIKRGDVKIVVDLAAVTYIDSAGVGMMVAEMKLVKRAGGDMKLAAMTARSHQLMGMLKLKLVFEIFEDTGDAVRSFIWGKR